MKRSKWNRHDLPIGEAVFIARTLMEMTHADLAARSGVHRNTLARLENGERPPTFEILVKVSAGLGVELSRLVRKAESLKPAP